MSDLYQRIVDQRGSLESLMAKIPGFRGYKEMTDRRAADRMMREHIVKLLKDQMGRLVNVEKKIISGGGLKHASETRSAKTGFQNFIDRINTAAPGYSGFFDAKKVGPDELQKIYSFDAALISYVDKFREAIDALDKAAQAKEEIGGAVTGLETVAHEANSAYALRDTLLTGLS